MGRRKGYSTSEQTAANIDKANALRNAGYSIADIAKTLDLSDSYVRVLLKGGTKAYEADKRKRMPKPKIECPRPPMRSEDPTVSLADIYQGPKVVSVNEAYANIACAITQQACKDYIHALNIIQCCGLEKDVCHECMSLKKNAQPSKFYLKTDPCQAGSVGTKCDLFHARKMKAECEDFFANRAQWFTPNICGAFVTGKLKERVGFNDEAYQQYKDWYGFKF